MKQEGGQNPIIAAKLGCKIYHGPYIYNFKEVYDFLDNNRISNKVENSEELSIKTWEPSALIYDYDTPSFNAYYIIEGEVEIFTPRGLKLNTIGPSEVFGEASLLLDKKRSVTARAGSSGVKTQLIPKTYIAHLQEDSPILSALLRNVQMRLIDSNEQSARYARDIEKLLKLAKEQNEISRAVTDTLETIQKRIENDFFSDY